MLFRTFFCLFPNLTIGESLPDSRSGPPIPLHYFGESSVVVRPPGTNPKPNWASSAPAFESNRPWATRGQPSHNTRAPNPAWGARIATQRRNTRRLTIPDFPFLFQFLSNKREKERGAICAFAARIALQRPFFLGCSSLWNYLAFHLRLWPTTRISVGLSPVDQSIARNNLRQLWASNDWDTSANCEKTYCLPSWA